MGAARRDGTNAYVQGLAALAIVIFVSLAATTPNFLSLANLNSMNAQFPEFGLLALAVLPALLSGGIDLSVVAMANLASIIAALVLRSSPELAPLAIPAGLLTGLACGLVNGMLIAWLRLPAILATLGTLQLFSGIGIVVTRGSAVTGLPEWYAAYGNWTVAGILPVPLIVFVIVALALGAFLRFTVAGFRLRLYGANDLAARFSGVRERRVILRTYAIAGLIASVAGLVILARSNSANAEYGGSYLLLVILINILGGVSPFGGIGSALGVSLAVINLQLISSGLNFLSFEAFMRDLFFGGLLVAVMALRAALATGVWRRLRPQRRHR